jgi:DNA-damage-inducible protein J
MLKQSSNINVRVDTQLKKDAEELFSDLGLTMSSAITLFLRSAVNNDGIPFEIKRVQLNKISEQALAEYDEMKRNPSAYKRYADFKELENELSTDV